ncbi:helix-turn-helix domain-containing protein [Acidobacteriota bacterium]
MPVESGQNLKQARQLLGWSQIRLAAHLDHHITYISQMENGRKPLSNKALTFISDSISVFQVGYDKDRRFLDKKVKSKLLKTNDKKLAQNGNFKGDEDFSETPQEMGSNEWEKWFWSDHNPLCMKCKWECKQSDKVDILSCPQFILK